MTTESDETAIAEALERRDTDALWAMAGSMDREVRKAAKRALHLLRSRGVVVGDAPIVTVPAAPGRSPDEESSEDCRVSAPDNAGEQLVLLPRKETKGYRLFQAMTSDAQGLVAFDHLDVSRRVLREIVADLGKRGLEIRAVSRARALALVGQAIRLDPARPQVTQALSDLPDLAPFATDTEQVAIPPPLSAEDRSALADSAQLFEEPELRGYLPEIDVLRETAAHFDEIQVSPLYLNDRQRRDQLQQTLERSIETYFTPSQRARHARRLRHFAEWFEAGGESGQAGLARAAAAQLESSESALQSPFARALFGRAFSLPAAPVATPEAPATSGGLILPGR